MNRITPEIVVRPENARTFIPSTDHQSILHASFSREVTAVGAHTIICNGGLIYAHLAWEDDTRKAICIRGASEGTKQLSTTLNVKIITPSQIFFDVSGRDGRHGYSGRVGSVGATGAPGCSHQDERYATPGAKGGRGGKGGTGGDGGAGEDGGIVKIYIAPSDRDILPLISVNTAGGRGGEGGPGGNGGPGGPGGPGGHFFRTVIEKREILVDKNVSYRDNENVRVSRPLDAFVRNRHIGSIDIVGKHDGQMVTVTETRQVTRYRTVKVPTVIDVPVRKEYRMPDGPEGDVGSWGDSGEPGEQGKIGSAVITYVKFPPLAISKIASTGLQNGAWPHGSKHNYRITEVILCGVDSRNLDVIPSSEEYQLTLEKGVASGKLRLDPSRSQGNMLVFSGLIEGSVTISGRESQLLFPLKFCLTDGITNCQLLEHTIAIETFAPVSIRQLPAFTAAVADTPVNVEFEVEVPTKNLRQALKLSPTTPLNLEITTRYNSNAIRVTKLSGFEIKDLEKDSVTLKGALTVVAKKAGQKIPLGITFGVRYSAEQPVLWSDQREIVVLTGLNSLVAHTIYGRHKDPYISRTPNLNILPEGYSFPSLELKYDGGAYPSGMMTLMNLRVNFSNNACNMSNMPFDPLLTAISELRIYVRGDTGKDAWILFGQTALHMDRLFKSHTGGFNPNPVGEFIPFVFDAKVKVPADFEGGPLVKVALCDVNGIELLTYHDEVSAYALGQQLSLSVQRKTHDASFSVGTQTYPELTRILPRYGRETFQLEFKNKFNFPMVRARCFGHHLPVVRFSLPNREHADRLMINTGSGWQRVTTSGYDSEIELPTGDIISKKYHIAFAPSYANKCSKQCPAEASLKVELLLPNLQKEGDYIKWAPMPIIVNFREPPQRLPILRKLRHPWYKLSGLVGGVGYPKAR